MNRKHQIECDLDCCFSYWVHPDCPDMAFSCPPVDPEEVGPYDYENWGLKRVCMATKEEWEKETSSEVDEEGYMGGVPVDCPIFQGEVRPPWEKEGV